MSRRRGNYYKSFGQIAPEDRLRYSPAARKMSAFTSSATRNSAKDSSFAVVGRTDEGRGSQAEQTAATVNFGELHELPIAVSSGFTEGE
jgi:hypothetical protein